jgi:peptidoglycan/LPS O-acetylase OafA/YrhL
MLANVNTSVSAARKDRVNEIDLLRFCAAMAVVFHHYAFRGFAADGMSVMPYPLLAPLAKYGYLGVELFFMISGFVILMTAANGSLSAFLISRVVRLYPAFWACCTLTFVTILAIGAPRYAASLPQYLINMTMTSGFVGVADLDGSYWSLYVEMKFYALVAVVLLLGRIRQAQVFLVLWLFASIALELVHIGRLRSLLIADYSAFFIAGAACFLVWSEGISKTRIGLIAASWCLAVWQSIAWLPVFEKRYNTPIDGYVVAGAVTTFFVIMFLISARLTGTLSRYRWTVAGAMTYPLYLLHQVIGFAVFNAAYPSVSSHVLLWTTITLMLALAYSVHVVVERRLSLRLKNILLRSLKAMPQRTNRPLPAPLTLAP